MQAKLAPEDEASFRFPTVDKFLRFKYALLNRLRVTFKRVEQPREQGITLTLYKGMSYDMVRGALQRGLWVERGGGVGRPGWVRGGPASTLEQ